MKTYEILYFDTTTQEPCDEVTDVYAIYEVSQDGKSERLYKQFINGTETKFDDEWFEYMSTGHEKRLTEKELFTLVL